MSQVQREYVLGTDDAELLRLGFQHRLWSELAHGLWLRARVRPGEQVIDVGCGPGYASLDLAMIVGTSGGVFGLDESERFINFAREQGAHRRLPHARFEVSDVADIERAVQRAYGSSGPRFDLAYIRWVLCFVKVPRAVIQSLARVMKPGGRVCIQDYFRYETMSLAPRSDAFERVIAGIARSWRSAGCDPDVMGRLPTLLVEAGFAIEHLAPMAVRPARPGQPMWEWPDIFWKVFLPRLEAGGFITKDEHTAFLAEWARACKDPGAFMHLPPMYELIALKA